VTGLKGKARVIPVLVEGARMPSAEDLPADLKPLARRNALEITEPDFENDVARLVRTLAEALAEPPPGAAPPAPHDAVGPRRTGLHIGLVAAGLGLLALVAVVAWLGFYFSRGEGGTGGQALTSLPATATAPGTRAADADSFDPVGNWEVSGVGTDYRSSVEMHADRTYSARGTLRGVYGEGTGTWERGENPRVIFFKAKLADGGEATARMEVRGEQEGGYRAVHSFYGDLILRRVAPR
jgi:hypothetical protein